MFIYIKRNYKEESKLPMDLRTLKQKAELISFWDYVRSEKIIVYPKFHYLIENQKFWSIKKRIYKKKDLSVLGKLSYDKKRMALYNKISIGSLIAIVVVSKHYHQFKANYYNEDYNYIPKYRIIFGHCLWKRKNKNHLTLLLRIYLVRTFFVVYFTLNAPNIITFFKLKVYRRKKVKYSSLIFKLKKNRRLKQLSHK